MLKRYERLKILKDQHLWNEGKSVLGIPKVKMQKLKVKKEKTASATVEGAPGATPGAGVPAASPSAKPAAESDKKSAKK